MNYERLPILKFGDQLLLTRDLDPIYVVLYDASLSKEELKRWFVAYWCSYNAGVSSWLCEQYDFWKALAQWAANDTSSPVGGRWPRGRERRHFRGQAGIKAVSTLAKRFESPASMVDFICDGSLKYAELAKRVQTLPLFGPWISFKVGDMLERNLNVPVDFSDTAILFFKEPYTAAKMVYEQRFLGGEEIEADHKVNNTVDYLLNHFRDYNAPPSGDRPVGPQEVETILCKWKSHMNGHYPVGIDSHELRLALKGWDDISVIAKQLSQVVPYDLAYAS